MATIVQNLHIPLCRLTGAAVGFIIPVEIFMVTEGWSMHEIGVVRQVLRTVEAFAKENELDMIDTIVLEIGDLSLVIPKYVEDIYNVIIKDTPFENTKLKIEVVEAPVSYTHLRADLLLHGAALLGKNLGPVPVIATDALVLPRHALVAAHYDYAHFHHLSN